MHLVQANVLEGAQCHAPAGWWSPCPEHLDKMEGEENKKRLKQFLTSLLEEGIDEHDIKKTDPKFFNLVKESLENLILYLKSKCEVFFWFYQGLPQLTQFGIW